VWKLLTPVHDGCILLGTGILIDEIISRIITMLPYQGKYHMNEFVGKKKRQGNGPNDEGKVCIGDEIL